MFLVFSSPRLDVTIKSVEIAVVIQSMSTLWKAWQPKPDETLNEASQLIFLFLAIVSMSVT